MYNYEMVFPVNHTLYERLFDTESKKSIFRKADYKPTIFTRSKQNKPTEWKYFLDESIYLEKHEFNNDKEYRDFKKFQEQIGNTTYGSMQAQYNHIRNNYYKTQTKFTSSIWYLDIETRVLPEQGFPYPDETPSSINMIQIYDSSINKIIILADENVSEKQYTNLMTLYPNLIFRHFSSEKELLNAFFKLIKKLNPCIITAWNGNNFDFPYITNRVKKIGLSTNNLSPVDSAETIETIDKTTNEKEYKTTWSGIYLLDMMELYKKFTYTTQTSYSLDNIIKVELGEGEGKVDYGIYKNISDFMHKDWDTFTHYGIKDVVLLKQLDAKLNLIELTRMIAYKMGVNVDDSIGTVKPWASYLTNVAYERGLIMPDDKKSEYKGIEGGWVSNPVLGKHRWIVSFDFASLYPSNIRWINMSPETIITQDKFNDNLATLANKLFYLDKHDDGSLNNPLSVLENYIRLYKENPELLRKASNVLKKENVACGVNGTFYRRDKTGLIPEVIEQMYAERKQAKRTMFNYEKKLQNLKENNVDKSSEEYKETERLIAFYNTEQLAAKIRLNSLYGALANKHFVLFNQGIAEGITANGRVINQFCSMKLLEYLERNGAKNSLIANDTDSAYFTLEKVIPEELLNQSDKTKIINWCDDYCKNELQTVINEALAEISDLLNAYDHKVQEFEREVIADSGFWVAKKRYVVRVLDQEGVRLQEPKLKIMGLDIIRSNTPAFCKKALKDGVEIILDKNESEIQEFIRSVKIHFYNQPIESISRVTGIGKLNYNLTTSKSIPINSRAGLVYNAIIDKLDLSKKYEYITTSDKIKYVYLKTPNPAFNQNVIGFKDQEFLTDAGLEEYIDKDEMFEKFFMSPMNMTLAPLNISAEKQSDFSEWE